MARPRLELLARHAAVLSVKDLAGFPHRCLSCRAKSRHLSLLSDLMARDYDFWVYIVTTATILFSTSALLTTGREEIRGFLEHRQRGELLSIFAHANYLINLATTNPQFHANSIRALSEELTRADQLELPFLVLHPGAHLGAGEEAGLEKIVAAINRVFQKNPKVKTRIALETTAGQGSCLGHRFEQIGYIIQNVREPERLCVCLDTAHVFAAGYDIGSEAGIKKTFREFDRVIGFNRLAAIHVNDSKTVRGSRVDRHQHIGKGQIGLDAFRFIMRDRRFRKIPKVLETPTGRGD